VQPDRVRFSSATADGPFTTISTNRVFPFRFNLVLETMEVRSDNQLARVVNIIVKAGETQIWLVYFSGVYRRIRMRAKVGMVGRRRNEAKITKSRRFLKQPRRQERRGQKYCTHPGITSATHVCHSFPPDPLTSIPTINFRGESRFHLTANFTFFLRILSSLHLSSNNLPW
jgi:hypothetical protein